MPQAIDARRLLRKFGVRPRKRLGQNFLVSRGALGTVVQAAELDAEDWVLEIGAGLGSLTLALAEQVREVVAVEFDDRLIPALREVVRAQPRVQVVHGDILELDPGGLVGGRRYLVVANIPYNITSAVIRQLTETRISPERIVLTIQREVAERAMAGPGQMSLLALSVQIYGSPSIRATIPPEAFYPRPAVESAVLRIDKHREPAFAPQMIGQVFELARAGFSQRRKMLKNALAAGLGGDSAEVATQLERADIGAKARAQELSLAEWVRLARVVEKLGA